MVICHIITDLDDGGVEAVLFRLCIFPQRGYRHLVIALGPEEKYASMLREAGVETHCLGLLRGRLTAGALLRLRSLLRQCRPDVVQTWMYHANLVGGVAARLAGRKNVVWGLHHSYLVAGTKIRTRLVNRLCAWLSSIIPSRIVACAEKARLVHEEYGYNPRKIVVVTNGCDTAEFQPDGTAGQAIRRGLGIGSGTPVIGFVGRWHADKDHANLIVAFARVARHFSDARLVLVGKGCMRENAEIRAQLQRNGVSAAVHLLGQRTDIPAIMNAFDIHVLPSRGEAFPNVVVEAMACGTPCVVTDVGDAALIAGDVGWVVPPGDSEQLAVAIADALQRRGDEAAWQARKHAVRIRIVERFSLERMVDRYHAVWNSGHL